METLIERCCGLDVHQGTVVACVLIEEGKRKPRKEVRTFRTLGPELVQMADWLTSLGITHVVMEGTGVYWRPIYNVLEGRVDITVANAIHVKRVPGRKTDVQDCQWIRDLYMYGLVRTCMVPDAQTLEIRSYWRLRHRLQPSGWSLSPLRRSGRYQWG